MKLFIKRLMDRFHIVLLFRDQPQVGEAIEEKDICARTARQIERWFQAGVNRFLRNHETGVYAECPSPEGTTERHWETRGYSYMARMERAYNAERELKAERLARDVATERLKIAEKQVAFLHDELDLLKGE